MRVLNANITLDSISGGGTAERALQMTGALLAAGHECTLVSTDVGDGAARAARLDDAELILLRCFSRRFYLFLPDLRRLRAAVRAADVVHLIGYWNLLNVVLYRLCCAEGTPYVVSPAGELIMEGRSLLLKRGFHSLVGNRMLKQAAGFIAITADEVIQFEEFGVPAERVAVIPNGVWPATSTDAAVSEIRDRLALGTRPVLLFVGRLAHIKGPDLLIDAFLAWRASAPDALLVFAGPDSGMLTTLRKRVCEHKAEDHIRFVGYIGGEDKWALYRAATLAIIPSRHEAMSMVVLEAGIMGVPVLLTYECGFPEVAAVDGGAVVPASAAGLAAGLEQLFAAPGILTARGQRLRALVESEFLWSAVTEKLVRYYRSSIVVSG